MAKPPILFFTSRLPILRNHWPTPPLQAIKYFLIYAEIRSNSISIMCKFIKNLVSQLYNLLSWRKTEALTPSPGSLPPSTWHHQAIKWLWLPSFWYDQEEQYLYLHLHAAYLWIMSRSKISLEPMMSTKKLTWHAQNFLCPGYPRQIWENLAVAMRGHHQSVQKKLCIMKYITWILSDSNFCIIIVNW